MKGFSPRDMKDLENPEFLRYVRENFPDQIEPDKQDFDPNDPADTEAEQAKAYRLAQARKLKRMYTQWRASLS